MISGIPLKGEDTYLNPVTPFLSDKDKKGVKCTSVICKIMQVGGSPGHSSRLNHSKIDFAILIKN